MDCHHRNVVIDERASRGRADIPRPFKQGAVRFLSYAEATEAMLALAVRRRIAGLARADAHLSRVGPPPLTNLDALRTVRRTTT
jgi:hypothetical protein